MEIFRERFRQTVRDSFNHDFVVIIVLRIKRLGESVFFQTTRDRKSPQVIRFAAQFRGHEIRKTVVGKANLFGLLTQMMAYRQHMGAGFITINFDIVAHAVSRE